MEQEGLSHPEPQAAGSVPEAGLWGHGREGWARPALGRAETISRSPTLHVSALTWEDGDVWTAELELPEGHHDYKLVIHNEDDDIDYWEMGGNRVLKVGFTPS